jgi:hypothetical protein
MHERTNHRLQQQKRQITKPAPQKTIPQYFDTTNFLNENHG